MLLPHTVVKGKVWSIPVQFYCRSLHIKSIEIACGISDVWAGSMYWVSSKWSEQIWYELYNCFAVFEPRSPGLVFMTHFLDLFRGRPWRYSVIPSTPDFPTEYQIRRHSNPAGLPTFATIWEPDFRASIIRLTCPHVFKQIKKLELL